MSHELQYTSVPQGLRAGSMGYCTVALTRNCPPLLQEKLENLSGYRHLYSPFDAEAALNPVCYQHLRVSIGGKPYSILSRVADAGVDYSNRTNKYAHHLALQSSECPQANPAWVLAQPGLLTSHWSGQPHYLETGRQAPRGGPPAAVASAWKRATGDAGWAGVLAEAFLAKPSTPYYLIFDPGTDVLSLFAEAIALLPSGKQWQVTFSTYFAGLSTEATCIWRAVVRHSPEAKQAVGNQLPVIDLTRSGPRAEGGALVHLARTGERLAEERIEEKPIKPATRVPAAKRVLDAEPYELTPAHRERVKPRSSIVEYQKPAEEPERRSRVPWMFLGLAVLLTLVFGGTIATAIWLFGGQGERQAAAKQEEGLGTVPAHDPAKRNESNPVPSQPETPVAPGKKQPTAPEPPPTKQQEKPRPPETSPEQAPPGRLNPEEKSPPERHQGRNDPIGPGGSPKLGGISPAPPGNPPNPGAANPGKSMKVDAVGIEPKPPKTSGFMPAPPIEVGGGARLPDPKPRAAQASDVIPITYKYLPDKHEEGKDRYEFTFSHPFDKAAFLENESIAGGVKMACQADPEKPGRLLIVGIGIGSTDPICSIDCENGNLVLASYKGGNLNDGINFVRSVPLLLSHHGKPTTLVAFVPRQDAEKPERRERLTAQLSEGELPSFNTPQKEQQLHRPFPLRSGGLLYSSAVSLWNPKLRQDFSVESLLVAPDDVKLYKGTQSCSANCYTCNLAASRFDPKKARFEATFTVQYRGEQLEAPRKHVVGEGEKARQDVDKKNEAISAQNTKIKKYVAENTPNSLSIHNYNVIVQYKQLRLAILNP